MRPLLKMPTFNVRRLLNWDVLASILFFAVGLTAGIALVVMISSRKTLMQPTATQSTPPLLGEVVVMLQTVPEGYILTENELLTDLRILDTVSTTMITNINQVIGQPARFDLYQGLTLTTDMIGPQTYKALMTTQPIPMGTPITADKSRYVSIPYDSPLLTTNTVVHNDRIWLVEMTALWDLEANTLVTWNMVNAPEAISPMDPYLATKSEVDRRREVDRQSTVAQKREPTPLTPSQKAQIARLAALDYLINFFLGVTLTVFIIRWWRWQRIRAE